MISAAVNNPMVFQFLFEDALAAMNNFASNGSAKMATIAAAAGIPMMGIYVMLYGFGILSGKVHAPVSEGLERLFKMTLIFTFATSAGVYNEYVIDFFSQVPGAIGSELAQEGMSKEFSMSDTNSTAQMLDGALGAGLKAGQAAWNMNAGLDIPAAVGYAIIAIAIWTFVGLVCAFGGALVLCANMGLNIMLAIGPLFIILAMFKATAQLFVAWTRQLITFGVFFIVIAAAVTLTFAFFSPFVTQLGEATNEGGATGTSMIVVSFIKLLCFCATAILCLVQSISWASGLAGGVGVAADGHLRRMMGSAISAAGGPVAAAGGAAIKAIRNRESSGGSIRNTGKSQAYLRGTSKRV